MGSASPCYFNGSQYLYSNNNDTNTTYTIFTAAAMANTQNQRLDSSANNNVLIGWHGGTANDLYREQLGLRQRSPPRTIASR